MTILLYFSILIASVWGSNLCPNNTYLAFEATTAYRYIDNIGIPRARKLKELETIINNESDSYRIVGGFSASQAQFPWQVGLIGHIHGSISEVLCGGSLITQKTVLTAAHCWDDGAKKVWKFTAVLASTMMFYGGIRMDSTNIIPHPGWVPKNLVNDIAMIVLPISLSFTDKVFPISLPTKPMKNLDGVNLYVSGFGIDNMSIHKKTMSQTLNFVNVQVVKQSQCWYFYPTTLSDKNICSDGTGGRNPCNGDSGGPLAMISDDKATLVGLVSYGSRLGCDAQHPAVYTRVDEYLDFIHSHIRNDYHDYD